jgi:hypothetical protein
MPFTKPCYGTMLYELDAGEGDVSFLRAAFKSRQDKKGRVVGGKKCPVRSRKQQHL